MTENTPQVTKEAEPLNYDKLIAQIAESGQPIEEAMTVLTAAVGWCIKQCWGGERAEQYNDAFNALLQRHIRVEGMDFRERLDIWWMNPGQRESTARIMAFNLDYAILDAEKKVREAATPEQFKESLHGYQKAVQAYLDVCEDFPDFLSFYEHQYLEKKHVILPAEFKREFSDLYDAARYAGGRGGEDSEEFKQADKAVKEFLHEHGIPVAGAEG